MEDNLISSIYDILGTFLEHSKIRQTTGTAPAEEQKILSKHAIVLEETKYVGDNIIPSIIYPVTSAWYDVSFKKV